MLLIDAFDADGIALSLAKSDFYACAVRRLAKNGVLVIDEQGIDVSDGGSGLEEWNAIVLAPQGHLDNLIIKG